MNLEEYKIDNININTCYYIPNFITESEEKLLLHEINKTPTIRWTQLSNRRLIQIGGVPTNKGMIAEEIPKIYQTYIERINDLNIFKEHKANHILLNEYLPGQGILPHCDGPLFYPIISTISLGSHTVLEFNKQQNDDDSYKIVKEFKLFIAPRSLLILKDNLYKDYMHGISEITEDNLDDPTLKNVVTKISESSNVLARSTRYSLTIRNVPRTSKMKLKFFK
ncbi:hypothetical protein PVAND_004406 [Polypedilum vanderplanki]|uniref:Fe2OG dioxygenase domain-containing protein n=1 Tax=Polypedilum vanderplanki TaxID=319348 RepID=A0A9J6BY09_POLVA|nr:hypothetical protein PVAND_004406 [Polypedilum vanderplanki]